ncbi:MAG TPA: mandelate racemase/muconate lactonizing enzyme family protein [Calidithermus sp.]|nr:mandelate racemase/muconate lactonizing enzyme family protein [Calidithermus sp.]
MRIADVQAWAVSFPLPPDASVRLGIGRAVKRDAVVVKVTTEDGVVGWGESHHGRSPGAVAHHVNTTLRQLVLGLEATDVVGVWSRIYRYQLGSHGLGAATAIAMSGIDIALWDIRGRLAGWPLYRLLGGAARAVPAYAGGVSLGFQDPAELVEEARAVVARGYRALKLRVGDSPERDLARVTAVRRALGDDVVLLTDANTGYSLADARRVMPALEALGVGWLEEPFPPHDHRAYAQAAGFARLPLAAGENHYTRFEFHRLIEDRAVTILQPDLSKTGGVTEALRIAALASAWKLPIHPHTSMTGLNMAATVHLLAAIDNAGFFEGDVSRDNLFRDRLVHPAPYAVDAEGCVRPLEGPGLGLEVDEDFLRRHPVIEGPAYV